VLAKSFSFFVILFPKVFAKKTNYFFLLLIKNSFYFIFIFKKKTNQNFKNIYQEEIQLWEVSDFYLNFMYVFIICHSSAQPKPQPMLKEAFSGHILIFFMI